MMNQVAKTEWNYYLALLVVSLVRLSRVQLILVYLQLISQLSLDRVLMLVLESQECGKRIHSKIFQLKQSSQLFRLMEIPSQVIVKKSSMLQAQLERLNSYQTISILFQVYFSLVVNQDLFDFHLDWVSSLKIL